MRSRCIRTLGLLAVASVFQMVLWNAITCEDPHDAHPVTDGPLPSSQGGLFTPPLHDANLLDVAGGYVIGAFDLIDPGSETGPTVVGEYRFQYGYDFVQCPEQGLVTRQSDLDRAYPLVVGNFRFGHSRAILDVNQLYAFSDWTTRIPDRIVLLPSTDIQFALNWEGGLP